MAGSRRNAVQQVPVSCLVVINGSDAKTPTFRKRRPRALCVFEMTGGPGFARDQMPWVKESEGRCLGSGVWDPLGSLDLRGTRCHG
jgi:hypothetical protein